MFPIFKSEIIEIYHDFERGLLIHQWKSKKAEIEEYTEQKGRSLLFYNAQEIEKIFNKKPGQIIEANLQTLLLNWEPNYFPQA